MKYKIKVTYPQYGADNGMDLSFYPSTSIENASQTVLSQLKEMQKTQEPGIITIEIQKDDE